MNNFDFNFIPILIKLIPIVHLQKKFAQTRSAADPFLNFEKGGGLHRPLPRVKFQGGSVETPFCYEYPKDPKRGLRQTPFLKGVFRGYLGGMNMVQWSCCDKINIM